MHACAHVCEYISVCVYVYVCARVCRNTGGVFNKVVPLVVADFVFDPCRLLFRAGRLSYMCFVCVCVCVCVRARVLVRARQATETLLKSQCHMDLSAYICQTCNW